MTLQSVRRCLSLLIYLIGGAFFLAVGIAIVKNYVTYNPSYFVMLAAGTLIFGVAAYISNHRIPPLLYRSIIAVVFLLMVALHRYCVVELQVDFLAGDAACVIDNARSLALTGDYVDSIYGGRTYFAQYQNQFGLLILYKLFFQFTQALFHTTDDACLLFLNQFAIDFSVLLTIIIAEKLGKEHGERNVGLFAAILCMFAPFLCLFAPLCYTDALCLPFLQGGILFAISIYGRMNSDIHQSKAQIVKEFLCVFCLGIIISIGYKVKGNLVILLIAIVIASFHHLAPHRWIRNCIALATAFVCVSLATSVYIKSSGLLTAEDSDRYKFPITHWIMMDIDSIGAPQADVDYTRSFPSYSEKKAAVSRRMQEKIVKMGTSGLLSHAFRKASEFAWNDGTFDASTYLGDIDVIVPKHSSPLHAYILRSGAHTASFRCFANVYWLLLLLPMVFSFFLFHRRMSFGLMLCQLYLVGTLLFFMLWETGWRYIFSSSLLVLTLAALQWKSLARIPAHILAARHCEFAQLPCFLNYEEKIRQEMAYGEEELARFHMKLYAGFIKMLSEKHYKSFKKRYNLLRRELRSIRMQRDLDEKICFFLQTWGDPDNCDEAELDCARVTGQRLLDDVYELDLHSKAAKRLRKWMVTAQLSTDYQEGPHKSRL